MSITHKPLAEEAVMYLILDLFADKDKLPKELSSYLASFHSTKKVTIEETIKEKVVEKVIEKKVNKETGKEEEVEVEKTKMVPKKVTKEVEVDNNKLLELVGASDKFNENLEKFLKKKDDFSLMVGPDFYNHPNSKNLAKLVALCEKYAGFKVVIIPALTNTLGVSLINELSDKEGEFVIGYNTKGDFTLSALGDGDLDMPAMNQQEGTLTSINKRVNPTNAAISYGGYELNDIANALGLESELTIDYTKDLPTSKGFKEIEFDNLDNHYTNAGKEMRGYLLQNMSKRVSDDIKVDKIDETLALDGETIIYLANPVRQFSEFTNKATNLDEISGLYMSEEFLSSSDFNDGDSVRIKTQNGELVTNIVSDNKIKGSIFILPTFDSKLNSEALFSGYRFTSASIERV